uniref:Glucosinolate transporter n=1 Tax=Phyllotreta armoraciae TaxID=1553667 RepID=A0A858Z6R5_9CUCU|nr:glucosinolate transporter [Phyllotreta armoraciae]
MNNWTKEHFEEKIGSIKNKMETESHTCEAKKEEKQCVKSDTFFLYFSVITVQLLTLASGSSMAWTSPVLGKLYSNDTNVNPMGRPITTIEVSMLAGIPLFTNTIGMLIVPKLSDIIGRKGHLLISGVVMLLSGIGLGFSSASVTFMIITRCLFGITGCFVVLCIYLVEICEDHNRGKFGCFTGIFNQIGHLFGFVIGPYFSVKNFSLIVISPVLIFIIFAMMLPESPVYLLKKGKEDECKNALRKLRRNKTEEEIESDMIKLKENFKKEQKGKIADLFKNQENLVALILSFLPMLLKYFSGVTVIFMFLAPFFDEAGTNLSGDTVAIGIAVFKILFFTLTSFIVERFGRRKMLLISSTGTSIPLFLIGIYFYLQHINSMFLVNLQWLPLTSLLFTVALFGLGLGPIPMPLISELPRAELKAVSGSVVHAVCNIVIFAITSLYPIISESLGNHWCVWWFSLNCLLGSILMYFFLPETKGKTFDEIQAILKG